MVWKLLVYLLIFNNHMLRDSTILLRCHVFQLFSKLWKDIVEKRLYVILSRNIFSFEKIRFNDFGLWQFKPYHKESRAYRRYVFLLRVEWAPYPIVLLVHSYRQWKLVLIKKQLTSEIQNLFRSHYNKTEQKHFSKFCPHHSFLGLLVVCMGRASNIYSKISYGRELNTYLDECLFREQSRVSRKDCNFLFLILYVFVGDRFYKYGHGYLSFETIDIMSES